MATTDPRAQHYVECTQCDRNAEYYCNSCTDRLCKECKKKHLISNASRNHDVVIYQEKQTSAPKIESCRIHPDLSYIMCCQQCEVPVCQKCIKENHKKHSFMDIEDQFESKKGEFHDLVTKVKNQIIPGCTSLLTDIQADNAKLKQEIATIQSKMTEKAKKLKDIIDTVLDENTTFLQSLEQSLNSELIQQEKVMNNHIAHLQNVVDEYDRYISTKQQAGFIMFVHENPFTRNEDVPNLLKLSFPSFTDGEASKKDIYGLFGKVIESTKPRSFRKTTGIQVLKTSEISMKPIPTAAKLVSFTAPGVDNCSHISPVAFEQAWVSDLLGHLVLTDTKGERLREEECTVGFYGLHAMSGTGDLLAISKTLGGIHKVAKNQTEEVVSVALNRDVVRSVWASTSSGDILVGIGYGEQARVIRFKKTGQEVHQIQYDNTGQSLYGDPFYITENHANGDICVSDYDKRALVVVDGNGQHRFSYKGHPPGSELVPYGISTDIRGHILVSDGISKSVQILDKDGHFLSFLIKTDHGVLGLGLDLSNDLLWVGESKNKIVSVYKYQQN